MHRLITFFFIAVLPLVAQSQIPEHELYNLSPNETLANLPLDTVFLKAAGVFNNMTGETDAQIKADFWKILSRSEATKNPIYIGKAYRLLAMWHYLSITSESPDSIYPYDLAALNQYLQTTDTATIAKAYADVGITLFDSQEYEEAEEYCMKGLALAKAIDDQDRIASIHSYLAIIYGGTQDYESALLYTKKIIAYYEVQEKTHPLIRALVSLSDIQVQTGEAGEAVASANRALALVEKLPEDYRDSESYNVRAWRGRAYKALGKYDDALEDLIFAWQGMSSPYKA
ncbi:MAG: tetratricopeptide repeat protein, partial [Bacteroidota bacterium]